MRLQLIDSDRVGKRLSICASTMPVLFHSQKQSLLPGVLLRDAGRCPLGEQSPGSALHPNLHRRCPDEKHPARRLGQSREDTFIAKQRQRHRGAIVR